jgi:hypothetical protein
MPEPPDAPSINELVKYVPAEHEYFLSFRADRDAQLFDAWWQNHGLEAWKKWSQKELRDNAEDYR